MQCERQGVAQHQDHRLGEQGEYEGVLQRRLKPWGADHAGEVSQANEAQIAVHWREEEYIYPPESFIAQANANDPAIYDHALKIGHFPFTSTRTIK